MADASCRSRMQLENHRAFLDRDEMKSLLAVEFNSPEGSIVEWIAGLKDNVQKLAAEKECSAEDVLSAGASLLQEFCVLNWLGPPERDAVGVRFGWKVSGAEWDKLNRESLKELSLDGEGFYPLAREPCLLLMARSILLDCAPMLKDVTHWAVWCLRCILVHQKLLEELAQTLWERADTLMSQELASLVDVDDQRLEREEKTMVLLEMSHVYLHYYQHDRAKEFYGRAQAMAGMDVDLTGALGKRTRFQTSDLAQLVLNVKVADDVTGGGAGREKHSAVPQQNGSEPIKFPTDVSLNDDTVLDHIQFAGEGPPLATLITPLQQAVLLCRCVWTRHSVAPDRLRAEEMEAYLRSILSSPMSWSIHTMALFLRSLSEDDRRVTVERAMTQLQVLVDQFTAAEPTAQQRLPFFYCTDLPPHWRIERELARQMTKMGCRASALEVYERLQLWEDAIECYQAVGRNAKAESLIREQLAERETPTLWCLLGDVTKDDQYYKKAWEVSGHKSARAQRSLGMLYLRQKKYRESMEALRTSVSINYIQEGTWFSLGCAANEIGELDTAAKAFHNCVSLEPENGEAWNNLAAVQIKRGDKLKAFHALQESLKRHYDSWRVWENYLIVSLDVGAFDQVIIALHRLMDIKDKYHDVEVLSHLVTAVTSGVMDSTGRPASRLRKELGEVLGRLTSQVSSNAQVWKAYSKFHLSSSSKADHEKGLLDLQKAHRLLKQVKGWERDKDRLTEVCSLTLEYSQVTRRLCEETFKDTEVKQQKLSSAKLALSSIVSRVKDGGVEATGVLVPVADEMNELESELEMVKTLLQDLQSQ